MAQLTATEEVVGRWHAVTAAVWGLVTATLALLLALPLALDQAFPAAALGPGRLQAAYQHVLLLGAVTPALSGMLLQLVPLTRGAVRRSAMALGLWQLGVVLGLVGILAGHMGPEPWLAAPAVTRLLLLVAALVWAEVLWRAAHRTTGPLPVALWFAVPAVAFLAVHLAVGLLVGRLGGASQAVAAAVSARGLASQWAATAGLAAAAAVLPHTLARPLYGRRVAVVGLVAWLVLAGVAAPWSVAADLLPPWLVRPVAAANVLLAVPATLVGTTILGTLIGQPRRLPSGAAGFLTAGVAAWLVGVLVDALGTADRPLTQFTAWDQWGALLPPLAALALLAIGASYATLESTAAPRGPLPVRYHLLLALVAALLVVSPAWPLGLAEAAGGPSLWLTPGAGGAFLVTSFRLRLAGLLLMWVVAAGWVVNVWPAVRGQSPVAGQGPEGWGRGLPEAPSAAGVMVLAVVAIVVTLLGSLFLPLADPAAVAWTPRAAVRELVAENRERGRRVYVVEGCVACHTQRVRQLPADAAYGPPTARGDYAAGPALAGQRRAGPDLSWVGDRYPDRDALLGRLAAHGANGVPALPWLFGPPAVSQRGQDVADYLLGLRSQFQP